VRHDPAITHGDEHVIKFTEGVRPQARPQPAAGLSCRRRPWARRDTSPLTHVASSAVRAQIGVDQLCDHRLALGNLSAPSIRGDVDRLVQRGDQQRRQVFLGPTAGGAGLALLEAGVQRRPAVVRRLIALCLGHVYSSAPSSSDAAYADCCKASATVVARSAILMGNLVGST
jgi:hypothetical protein